MVYIKKFNESNVENQEMIDSYIDLEDFGFVMTKNTEYYSQLLYASFDGEYLFEEVIEKYINFITKLQLYFKIIEQSIKFSKKQVRIKVNLIEINIEGSDSVTLKVNNKDYTFKILKIDRDMTYKLDDVYLSRIRFFISNSNLQGWIDYKIEYNPWDKDSKKQIESHINKYNRIFINPIVNVHVNDEYGEVKVDEDNAKKLYKYFCDKRNDNLRYNINDDNIRIDFAKQFTYKDLIKLN